MRAQPAARVWPRRRRTFAPSFHTSQGREIGYEILELGVGEATAESGHQAFAELLVELFDRALPVRVKLIGGVAQLDGERILVDAHAADDRPVGGHDLHPQILCESAA